MKLFTVGPVEMFPATLEIAGKQLPYFRTPEFSKVMLENKEMFLESIYAPEETEVVFLTASGTAAMEAAVINCFTKEEKLLVINGGSFGARFGEICAVHQIPHDELVLPFGETLTREKLEAFAGKEYAGLLVNLHETSTGQLYDIKMLSAFCRENNMYLVVDGISAYGADEINFEKHGIDVLIVSSQKALALSPGLSIIAVSKKIYENKVMMISSGSLYLDFKSHINNLRRGQTPFTPAVGILLELHERLEQIRKTGILQMQQEMHDLAVYFRELLQKKGFSIPEYPLSNALTPVMLYPYAKKMYDCLKEDYDLVVTPSGGEMSDELIRIGHLGCMRKEDYKTLLSAMEKVREAL